MRDHQVAARRNRVHEPPHDRVGVRVIDVVQDGAEHDSYRFREVEGGCGAPQDVAGIAQVAVDEVCCAACLRVAQRVGVREDDRVTVDRHDPRVGRDLLGDGVHAAGVRDAGADVEELADTRLARHPAHRSPQERPIGTSGGPSAAETTRHPSEGVCGSPAVDLEMANPAEQEVVDPGRMRDHDVDLDQLPGAGGTVGSAAGHIASGGVPNCGTRPGCELLRSRRQRRPEASRSESWPRPTSAGRGGT